MNTKILSLALAATFMFAALAGVIYPSDQADADVTTSGVYSVYAYNGSAWDSDIVDSGVYDAAQAVVESDMWASGDSMVSKYTTGQYVTYNADTYGNINTFMGLVSNTEANYWHTYFVDADYEVAAMTASIGNYTCFSDYDTDYQTANIILYYGSGTISASTVETALLAYMEEENSTAVALSDITEVSSTDEAFKVTFKFHISVNTVTATVNGTIMDSTNTYQFTDANLKSYVLELDGYGSNAYLALVDAITTNNINAYTTIPMTGYYYYSWIDTMFNLGTVQTAGQSTPTCWEDDSYAWWILYDTHSQFSGETDHQADFVLGAYGTLSCAPIHDQSFALYYEVGNM